MNKEPRCRPQFKSIERFLRRIAFNLGNTPSQTEVKIVSCIPIDVTDLQQKILQLERQLEEHHVEGETRCATHTTVSTALCPPLTIKPTSAHHPGSNGHQSDFSSSQSSSRKRKSSVSFDCPASATRTNIGACPCRSVTKTCIAAEAPEVGSDRRQPCKRLFRITKKTKEKDRDRTQLVYFAQTDGSPFENYSQLNGMANSYSKKVPHESDAITRTYLADMVRKQYSPDRLATELSDISQFSSPVCRDVEQGCGGPGRVEGDACSCCRGQFHDVDRPARDAFLDTVNTYSPNEGADHSMYYDSSLYDVVPVRDRPTVLKNDEECRTSKEPNGRVEFKGHPAKICVKSGFQPSVFDYHNTAVGNARATRVIQAYRRKVPIESPNTREYVHKVMRPKRKLIQRAGEASHSCSIDFGDIYMKPLYAKAYKGKKINQPTKVKPVLKKNAECLTTSVNNTECQTVSSKSVQLDPPTPLPPEENKTEVTLNQIKTILQTVLTEVKTNTQLKSATEKIVKDAIVQKEPSQGNINTGSRFLNSFTYSPYSISPYAPSYSRQMTANQYCDPGSYPAHKCLQNYPLFIQTTGRQCSCYYRNIPACKAHPTRHAASASTNTEELIHPQRNKETEELIKEIYKSVAINMDFPTKDTSTSEYDDLKSSTSQYKKKSKFTTPKESKQKVGDAAAELSRRRAVQDSATTPIYTNMRFENSVASNQRSMRSENLSKTNGDQHLRHERIEGFPEPKRMRQSSESGRDRQPFVVELPNVSTTTSDDDINTPSSDGENSDGTVVPSEAPVESPARDEKQKQKKGLFSKVVNLFKTRQQKSKKKEGNIETETDEEESEPSDSDDYQTIYSHRSEKRPLRVTYDRPSARPRPRRRTPHSKVSYSRYVLHHRDRNPQRARRSPYNMEQEYRRQWNERLTFHEGRTPHCSSERPVSRELEPPARHPYPYYRRHYEARSALFDHADEVHHRSQAVDEHGVTTSRGGLAWLKKHKLGIHCGEQWKKLLIEG